MVGNRDMIAFVSRDLSAYTYGSSAQGSRHPNAPYRLGLKRMVQSAYSML